MSQNQRALHIVFPHQFLDSPEWFGVSTDDYFQVRKYFLLFLFRKYSNIIEMLSLYTGLHNGNGGIQSFNMA